MKKALLLVNPKSGKQAAKKYFFDIVNNLSEKYEVTVHLTKSTEDLVESARTTAFTRVIVCGGDGTLSGAVSGILQNPNREKIRIGYIPSGTANDVATTLGIPKTMAAAAQYVIKHSAKPHDIGLFNDRSFVYTASFGTFARVAFETPQNMKNLLGNFAYLLSGAQELLKIKGYDLTLEVDGKVMDKKDITFFSVSNSHSLGGGVLRLPSDRVGLDDGKLELLLIARPKHLIDLENIVRSIAQKEFNNEYVTLLKAKEIKVRSSAPMSFTLDGEDGGEHTEVTIRCLEGGINLVKA